MPLRRNRDFALLWTGQAVSSLGSQVSAVAFPLLVLAVTGSPSKAGLVGLARNLPIAVLALPAGELADRLDRRRLMIGCAAARMLAIAAIPLALAAGSVPYGLIAAVAFVDGSAFVVSYVTERGLLGRIVPPEQLGDAVALNESRMFGALLAGPPIGGVLFGIARAVPFLVDAVSYAAQAATLLLIRTDLRRPRDAASPRDLRQGLRWIWARPFFRASALLFAGSNPIFTGLTLLIVIVARDHGAAPSLVGLMLAIAAAGGLVGALAARALARRWTPRTALVVETWVLVAALPWLLLTHEPVLLGLIVAVAELFTPVTNAIIISRRVAAVPDPLQGRVQAASTVLSFSAGWVGPLAVGVLLQHAGTRATVLALTGWALCLAVAASRANAFRGAPA